MSVAAEVVRMSKKDRVIHEVGMAGESGIGKLRFYRDAVRRDGEICVQRHEKFTSGPIFDTLESL